jgi:uncharacterized FlaG/YvyC family protein
MRIVDTGVPVISPAVRAAKRPDPNPAHKGALPMGESSSRGDWSLHKAASPTKSAKSWSEATDSPSKASIKGAAARLGEDPSFIQRTLKFKVHQETGEVFVQITNSQTGKVLTTTPSESVLDLHARFRVPLRERALPVLVDRDA